MISNRHLYRLADLIELRKLRKSKEGIDVAKLNKGNVKKKKRPRDESEIGGLKKGASTHDDEEYGFENFWAVFCLLICYQR